LERTISSKKKAHGGKKSPGKTHGHFATEATHSWKKTRGVSDTGKGRELLEILREARQGFSLSRVRKIKQLPLPGEQ